MTDHTDREQKTLTLSDDDIVTDSAVARRSMLSMLGAGVVGSLAMVTGVPGASATDRDRTRRGDPGQDNDYGPHEDRAADNDRTRVADAKSDPSDNDTGQRGDPAEDADTGRHGDRAQDADRTRVADPADAD